MEVMFALALIGIALTTLLASQSQGLSLANEAKFYKPLHFWHRVNGRDRDR
jgi:hypothetical protein